MRYTITRGQYRLNQAQKQAATITKATVQGYQDYLNPSDDVKNASKTIVLEQLDLKGKKFLSKEDINDNPALWATKPFDKDRFPEVHRTNFAEQAKQNILIAQDQKMNTAFWDNFGTKKCRWGLNWENLQNFRESVQPQKALAQDDTHKMFGDHTVANKIFSVQGQFNSLRHDILDPAKAEENEAIFQASQNAYEAGEYFQKRYRTSLK